MLLNFRYSRVAFRSSLKTPLALSLTKKGLLSSLANYGNYKKINLNRIRNLGIIAHVDAGKTTTSERMLYYSGESNFLGDVDKGDTMLDYMKMERERGITINSAAITFHWKDHTINLIDTPGHVDFTAEVERSLRVLDGAITIFDGVSGVQAQTETVWAQANQNHVPRIAFVNKLDREGASLNRTLESMRTRLSIKPILLQYPVGLSKNFTGIVDLITLEILEWNQESSGMQYSRVAIDKDSKLGKISSEAREELVENLASIDDQLMEILLKESVSSPNVSISDLAKVEHLEDSLRRISIEQKAIPVLIGASLKNIGVQPLLDAVTKYLPSPIDRPPVEAYVIEEKDSFKKSTKKENSSNSSSNISISSSSSSSISSSISSSVNIDNEAHSISSLERNKSDFVNLKNLNNHKSENEDGKRIIQIPCDIKGPLIIQAFKVIHDARMNNLNVFCRVYSGVLRTGQKLFNVNKGVEERSLRIARVYADRYQDTTEIIAGDIGAITGLKNTQTGDTLVSMQRNGANNSNNTNNDIPSLVQLSGINIPDPVFWMSILADSLNEEDHLRNSLNLLQLEDPSFRWIIHKDTSQWLLGGMGELHLEIIKDRLFEYYKVKATTGDIRIAYKSTVENGIVDYFTKSYSIGCKSEEASLKLAFVPLETCSQALFEIDKKIFDDKPNISKKIRNELVEVFTNAAKITMGSGIPAGYPLANVKVVLEDMIYDPSTSPHVYKLCLMEAIVSIGKKAGIRIMEPIMRVELSVNQEYFSGIMGDLTSKRRAQVKSISVNELGKKIIHCFAPLVELVGYSTTLRSLSKGSGSYTMEFDHNKELFKVQQDKLLGYDIDEE